MNPVITSQTGSLAELQGAFQDFLLARGDDLQVHVRHSRRAERTTLLEVYRDGYALRLIEVLTTDYPGVVAMLGPDRFDAMARTYIGAHPSRHPSARWFGSALADFLASTSPWCRTPAVAEMARFEWTLSEAWDAPDMPPVPAAALIALQPDAWTTLAFGVLPSLRLLTLTHEVPLAWQGRDSAMPGNLQVEAASTPVRWVIWRSDLTTRYRALDTVEAALLDATIAGATFPQLCTSIADITGGAEAVARAAGALRAWVEEGMIGSFRT